MNIEDIVKNLEEVNTALKECPFCGKQARLYFDGKKAFARCIYCGSQSDTFGVYKDILKNAELAKKFWNNRVKYYTHGGW